MCFWYDSDYKSTNLALFLIIRFKYPYAALDLYFLSKDYDPNNIYSQSN
ncbi:31834_t:CDS:2, partial [Gigaspora margarita]